MFTSILSIWSPDNGGQYALVQDLGRMADDIERAILNPTRIRITTSSDVTLTSTAHPFQIGPTNASNLAADDNEIQSRNNGSASILYLNNDGGDVSIGTASSVITAVGGFQEGWNALGDINLNQVVTGGRYIQTSSANATYARNYPVDRTGVLEVISNAPPGATGGARVQKYTNYNIPMEWIRSWSSADGWSAWANITPLTGTYDFSGMSANTTSTRSFTFPAGAFRSGYIPAVNVSASTGAPQNVSVQPSAVSNTGFTIAIRRTDAADATRVFWSAM